MADGQGFGAGLPPINFHSHLARMGPAGASRDFELMLGMLVSHVEGEVARLIWANPGDWGIDVLVGDLNGRVKLWQAKFFVRGFGRSQREQVTSSFQSAMRAMGRHGHQVERWTLCVPCSMDAPTTRWWQDWAARRQSEHGVQIELWDEIVLQRLLAQPNAAGVRRSFYESSHHDRAAEGPVLQAAAPAPGAGPVPRGEPDVRWRPGVELSFGADRYLLLGDAVEERGARLTREATADQVEPRPGRVWLRQVRVLSPGRATGPSCETLRAQARLLAELSGTADIPRLLDLHEEPGATTLVVARPPAPTWAEQHGLGRTGEDRFATAAVLGAALALCAALHELHRRGASHRALRPESILVVDGGRRAVLRDLGLAAVPPAAGEGPPAHRAPEQRSALGPGGPPGPLTDVYRLAAVLYETLTGHRAASPGPHTPLRALAPQLPASLDELLGRALDADARRRPGGMPAFATGLHAARRELSRGAGR